MSGHYVFRAIDLTGADYERVARFKSELGLPVEIALQIKRPPNVVAAACDYFSGLSVRGAGKTYTALIPSTRQ